MISIELNEVFKNALSYAKEQRHEYLTLEHIFLSILSSKDGQVIFEMLDVDIDGLEKAIASHIHSKIPSIPSDNIEPFETPLLSKAINEMIHHINSSGKDSATIGDMLVAIYAQENTYASYLMKKEGISKVDILEVISHELPSALSSVETKKEQKNQKSYLAEFTIELCALAKEGKIDPVIGRDSEIQRVMQTLCRRKKNNPLLVGEPGVGKTAIAEGLALK